jgi:DNA-binding CsgD family transcriptional regulator
MDVLDALIVRDLAASLTREQREVLDLLIEGHSQTTAARELGISSRAVRYHIRQLRARFRDAA